MLGVPVQGPLNRKKIVLGDIQEWPSVRRAVFCFSVFVSCLRDYSDFFYCTCTLTDFYSQSIAGLLYNYMDYMDFMD